MKIRVGFVSNSSTSSFVVVGYWIDSYKEQDKEFHKILRNLSDDGKGLPVELDWLADEDQGTYIGIDPTKQKDDETKKEFYIRVQTKVNELIDVFNKDRKASIPKKDAVPTFITVAWYDG